MVTPNDPFRKEYRELTELEKAHMTSVKEKAFALYEQLFLDGDTADQRSMAVARTKLEEAVMWAVKSITA